MAESSVMILIDRLEDHLKDLEEIKAKRQAAIKADDLQSEIVREAVLQKVWTAAEVKEWAECEERQNRIIANHNWRIYNHGNKPGAPSYGV